MSEEIKVEGVGIASGVLETIVTLATESVEGVARVCPSGLARLMRKSSSRTAGRSVEVLVDESGRAKVSVHICVVYGNPLHGVASAVQATVAEALASQAGLRTDSVDVFVDGIEFPS